MQNYEDKYERAAKRVKELKGFYRHLKIFVVINGFLLLAQLGVFNRFIANGFELKPYYFSWVYTNIFVWFIVLLAHFIILHRRRLPFLKNWEKKQIEKYMQQEKEEVDRYSKDN